MRLDGKDKTGRKDETVRENERLDGKDATGRKDETGRKRQDYSEKMRQ